MTLPKKLAVLDVVRLGVSILLLVAVSKQPYSYYIILRWTTCAAFAWLSFTACKRSLEGWAWSAGAVGVLYNPIVPIHLDRSTWMVINLLTIAFLLASVMWVRERSDL